jgi:predicted RNase H-like HicB family nuclease
LTFKIHEEDGQYVARCEELGISSCARTIEKAFQRAEEATSLYLHTIEEVGERDRVFAEAGIKIHPGEPVRQVVSIRTEPDHEFVTLRRARLPEYAFS